MKLPTPGCNGRRGSGSEKCRLRRPRRFSDRSHWGFRDGSWFCPLTCSTVYQPASCTQIFGPVTLGISRRLVLLPASMLDGIPAGDLHAVIAHEFAHIRRNDFLKNLDRKSTR